MKKLILSMIIGSFAVGIVLNRGIGAMQTPNQSITLKTNDGKNIVISREQADQFKTIKSIFSLPEDEEGLIIQEMQTGEVNLNLVSSKEINSLLNIMNSINQTGDQYKRSDGKYIAQKIQPFINTEFTNMNTDQIYDLLNAANFLGVPDYMLNGIVRVFVQKELEAHPAISVEALEKKINIAYLNQFIQKQYPLVKDNIQEKSVADHIALNTMWQGAPASINLSGFGITSLEGLEEVPHIDFVKEINLSRNKLASIGPNTFKGFTNLQKINLTLNQKITHIDQHAFDGLSELKTLALGSTTLKNLNMTKQQLQQYCFPNNQQIQIAVYPDSLAADVQ